MSRRTSRASTFAAAPICAASALKGSSASRHEVAPRSVARRIPNSAASASTSAYAARASAAARDAASNSARMARVLASARFEFMVETLGTTTDTRDGVRLVTSTGSVTVRALRSLSLSKGAEEPAGVGQSRARRSAKRTSIHAAGTSSAAKAALISPGTMNGSTPAPMIEPKDTSAPSTFARMSAM